MKCLQVLSLIIISAFSTTVFAEVGKGLKVAKTQPTVNNLFPNPFRPIIDIFKKVLGIKPKVFHCGLPPSVVAINLSETEIYIGKTQTIRVQTIATDPENTLIYSYAVTGGKIVATDGTDTSKFSVKVENTYTMFTEKKPEDGEKVIWDLSGVKPGTYTITAAVDDGCGFCGKTMTKTVIVKE
jgi:hypothetical protein